MAYLGIGKANGATVLGLNNITWAVSSQWHTFPERFDWIGANGFAMAYTPQAEGLQHTAAHVKPYLDQGVPVRYHGFFPGFELGDVDVSRAEQALALHMRAIDAIVGLGDPVMTVHIDLLPSIEVKYSHILQYLGRLAAYARERGVTLCLENLRTGITSDPANVLEIATECGTGITLDIGHAVTCEQVVRKETTVAQIVERFRHRLQEVHFYEYEADTHYAPSDMAILGPVVDALLETDCRWWTIELNHYADILKTRRLALEHLMERERSLVA
jgi:sugar phosphate isomerase/epimerase